MSVMNKEEIYLGIDSSQYHYEGEIFVGCFRTSHINGVDRMWRERESPYNNWIIQCPDEETRTKASRELDVVFGGSCTKSHAIETVGNVLKKYPELKKL